MSMSPLLSSTVLGKRKQARDSAPLILHLASSPEPTHTQSDSDFELETEKGLLPIIVNGELVLNTKRKYKCTYEGCTKAYTKPSRLEEHERSHTGERPFSCPTCPKSYLRETHLQAHARSHLPESARPLECPEPDCTKRFWTTQHLRVHESMHKGAKPYSCTEPSCSSAFAKHHQLRAHVCSAHAPPGTKPYRCEHEGCTKSFSTNQKLRTHSKVHDDKRYTCVHPSCLPLASTSAPPTPTPKYYPTWTLLQHHIRTVHPPTCTHPSCAGRGRTFASQHGLRAHLKLHEEREVEEGLVVDGESEGGGEGEDGEERPKKKRRRGGEVGRDWKCAVAGCEKDFKSKKALTTHHNITHLGRRDHICPHGGCGSTFGYKHLLQRHLTKFHSEQTDESDSNSDSDSESTEDDDAPTHRDSKTKDTVKAVQCMDINTITGLTYATNASERLSSSTALRCPHPHHLVGLVPASMSADAQIIATTSTSKGCEYVFSRAYDLRRHLRAEHGVEVGKERVDAWVRERKAKSKDGRQ